VQKQYRLIVKVWGKYCTLFTIFRYFFGYFSIKCYFLCFTFWVIAEFLSSFHRLFLDMQRMCKCVSVMLDVLVREYEMFEVSRLALVPTKFLLSAVRHWFEWFVFVVWGGCYLASLRLALLLFSGGLRKNNGFFLWRFKPLVRCRARDVSGMAYESLGIVVSQNWFAVFLR